jgi:hypothetical protein
MSGRFAPNAAARTSQSNSKSRRQRWKHGMVPANYLVITAWLEHATHGLGNRFQRNNVRSLSSSCCKCVASADHGRPSIAIIPDHERPLRADCVEEVGELIDRNRSKRQARAGSLVLKRASEQAAGSALPAFGDSGLWPPGGTHPEHQWGLSA